MPDCVRPDAWCGLREHRLGLAAMAADLDVADRALMSVVGSPATNTTSARSPAAIRPRSSSRKTRAAGDVAACKASTGVRPAPTSRALMRSYRSALPTADHRVEGAYGC